VTDDLSILQALDDDDLFGAAFKDRDTWAAWRTFLAACFGLWLESAVARECFTEHTGRSRLPTSPAREAWVIAGRRGGKSRIAALVSVFLAAFRDYSAVLAPGERGTLPIIAADRRQARTVLRYVNGLLDGSPMLKRLVVNRTNESVELSTRVTIEVHTCSFRAVRGYTLVGAILDEVAFYRSDDSANPDTELVAALQPGMATVPGALLVAISSPYARRGVLWDAYAKHYGHDDDPILVWRASTRDMNPTVSEAFIAEQYAEDESTASAEYGAEFRKDVETFIAREVIDAAVITDRHELLPSSAVRYSAFVDPSGGSQDAFTLAIAHGEKRGKEWLAVLDCIREVRPPFSPAAVVADFAELLKAYRVTSVVGDRYGGEFPRELFAREGIHYEPSERTKSDIYLEVLPLLNAHRVELLEHKRLHTQLIGLERRTARGGRDTVDHAPRAHDDLANAAAGALLLASEGPGTAIPQGTNLLERPYKPVDWSHEFPEDRGIGPGAIGREFDEP
jgi:hypothetical protein